MVGCCTTRKHHKIGGEDSLRKAVYHTATRERGVTVAHVRLPLITVLAIRCLLVASGFNGPYAGNKLATIGYAWRGEL